MRLLLEMDSQAAVAILSRGAAMHESDVLAVKSIRQLCLTHDITLVCAHIPRARNTVADALSTLEPAKAQELTLLDSELAVPFILEDWHPSPCTSVAN